MQLRDGTITHDPRLDRLEASDPRTADYSVRELLGAPVEAPLPAPRTRRWKLDVVLDQGREGACVGFGITHALLATPKPIRRLNAVFARETVYWGAQQIDRWPGGAYPGAEPHMEGTSVLAGLKVIQKAGWIANYHWCKGIDEVVATLGHLGPVVLGLRWHQGMSRPDPNGFIRPTGEITGGHCLVAVGVAVQQRRIRLHNSWGPKWGMGGTAYISFDDLASLLDNGGDAALLVGKDRSPKKK